MAALAFNELKVLKQECLLFNRVSTYSRFTKITFSENEEKTFTKVL